VHLILECRMCDSRFTRKGSYCMQRYAVSAHPCFPYDSTEANGEFHAYLPKWSCPDYPRQIPAGKHCHFQWLLSSIWPRGGSPYWLDTSYVRVCLLNERARAFMRSATASPWGCMRKLAYRIPHFSFSLFLIWPHENTVTPYSRWCEIPQWHWFTWTVRFIVYTPISHSIWLHSHIYTHREHNYPHSFLSTDLHNKIKFPCVVCSPVKNDSTNFQ